MRRMKIGCCLGLSLSLLLAGCGQDGHDSSTATYELKIVYEEASSDVQGQYVAQFEKLVEARTDGKVDVVPYSAGQLGDNEDHLKMVEDSAVQAAVTTPSITGSIIPENQVLSVPFVFSEDMDVNFEVLRNSEALNEDLASIYKERGLSVLSFWTEGFMAWTSNRPIGDPAAMAGTRIRTMTSPMLLKFYSAIGANPTPMDAGEVYTALQTNMIDATGNPLFFLYSGNMAEVQDYLTLSRHHIYVTSTVFNSSFLQGLDDDTEETIREVVGELEAWSFKTQKEANTEALAAMRESDMEVVELSDAQRGAFRDRSDSVRESVGDVAGARAERIMGKLMSEVESEQASGS